MRLLPRPASEQVSRAQPPRLEHVGAQPVPAITSASSRPPLQGLAAVVAPVLSVMASYRRKFLVAFLSETLISLVLGVSMTTRTLTGRAIEVPDLVGVKADQAIQQLRALGLMPIAWSAAVDDVNHAGFVLGLDPPAGTSVRPKAHVTMSVATHPDFQGHVDDTQAGTPDELVQPPLTWPLSSPTGFTAPASAEPADPFATAAAPGAPSAPASPPLDAAYVEAGRDDAPASSVGEFTPGAAADPYLSDDGSAAVPTPEEISADAEWDRLRAAEAARHAAGPAASQPPQTPPGAPSSAAEVDETTAPDSAQALEEQARREARRRRARHHGRLTTRQKALVAGVLALTVLIVLVALSGHKPVASPPVSAHVAQQQRPAHTTRARVTVHHHKRAKTARVISHHKPAKSHRRRVKAPRRRPRSRSRVRVRTVTVHASPPPLPQTTDSTPAAPVSATPADTTPVTTSAAPPPVTTTQVAAPPAAPPPSHQPASAQSSTDSHSSGTGSASTLQSPSGTTPPPQP